MKGVKTIKFGGVEVNLSTAPTNKKDFEKKFKGKVPDIAKAWDDLKKAQKSK